jgi:hypothetical protein
MFLHFIIASVFMHFALMAYSHYTFRQATTLDFVVMKYIAVFWFARYIPARLNRKTQQPQMQKLDELIEKLLPFTAISGA